MKAKLSILFTLLVITTMLAAPIAGFSRAAAAPSTPTTELAPSETGLYIVRLADPSLAAYMGGKAGLAATSPEATGARKLDTTTPASVAYTSYLSGKQAEFISTINRALGREVEVAFQYLNVLNAMSVRVDAAEAAQLAQLPGVIAVWPDQLYELDTDYTPGYLGATDVWAGDVYDGTNTYGDDVIVGIIDSGINSEHPAFAEVDGDGYSITNPYGSGVYHGWCVANPTFCTDKLIGAYGLNPSGGSPEDLDGHGSHTASTVAGNIHDAVVSGIPVTLAGMAPHANVVAYKVCNPSCPGSATLAALDLSVPDGVDVINYSISGGDSPWNDAVDLGFLEVTAAGIFVSASAGNSGPAPSTVAHTGPWNASVAASNHPRAFLNPMDITGPAPVPPELLDIGMQESNTGLLISDIDAEIDYDATNLEGCNAFPADYFDGKIALIKRGTCTFVVKITNATNAGAIAVVVFNRLPGPPISMDATGTTIPSTMISLGAGEDVIAFLDAETDPVTAHLDTDVNVVVDITWGDAVADFSSRGPSNYDLVKPDYAAPGVNVLAAVAASGGDPVQYAFLQGTSMASPHSAGSAALLVSLHPEWSVPEVKSALSSASIEGLFDSDYMTIAGPLVEGAGRIQIDAAANVGLVFDESLENYEDANPSLGGDPKTLNQPSMMDQDCMGICTWTRTVRNSTDFSADYTVDTMAPVTATITVVPSSFTIAAGGTQELVITADVTGMPSGEWVYGTVYLDTDATYPGGEPVSDLHLPMAVIPTADPAAISVEPASIEQTQPVDTTDIVPLEISNVGELPLTWEILEDNGAPTAPSATWTDNFDDYDTGVSLHGLGGWKGWANDPLATAYTSDLYAVSAPNSVEVISTSDLVHEYTGYDSGVWEYSAMQYLPDDYTGQSYFIMLNQYDDAGATNNWSLQVMFDDTTGLATNAGISGGTLPLIYGEWVELKVVIDLDNDTQEFYYGGDLLYAATWTEENSGGGITNIAAVDLFGNSASEVYYDDISLLPPLPAVCEMPSEIPWVSVDPAEGTTLMGETTPVSVTFDTTGLTVGSTYTGTLCVLSNDPFNPIVPVPLTLDVTEAAGEIFVDPTAITMTLAAGDTGTSAVTISNLGNAPLTITGFDGEPAWLTITPTSTVIAPSESEEFTFTFDATDLMTGTYTATVTVLSDDPMNPEVDIEVTLIVTEPGTFTLYLPIIIKD